MSSILEPDSSIVEDPIATALDKEIANLQEQISQLKQQRALATSTILSSRSTLSTLSSLRAAQESLSNSTKSASRATTTTLKDAFTPSPLTPLLQTSKAQSHHNTTNLYRTLSSILTSHITDPDPYAVDNGHILALHFDICVSNGKFTKQYHVMLNRPFGEEDGNDERKGLYRVHRHTLPACIPLASLAKRWLPNGKGVVGSGLQGGKRQDMKGFVRAVRRELVGYHKRIAVIKGLRTSFDLDEPTTSSNQKRMEKRMEKGREKVIVDITPADAEAKQVRIEWRDGRIGRVQMDEEGKMLKCVVIGEEGRDRDIEGRITRRDENGNEARIEELCERLMEGIY